jgi:ectoine hydroxylase-related dioxygenase (phytanoyl-CoA dioxygenase family)
VLSSFQSNIIYPGGPAQQLHVDGWSFSGVPLPQWSTRLNVNFILTDWTETNGATLVVPGSHKLFRAPNPEEVPQEDLLKLVAPKGSLVLWTGHTWHQSGTNDSSGARFGLFACFAASQLKEVSTEEEHLSIVDAEVMETLSPEFRFMIGLDRGIKKGALYRVDFSNTEFVDE